MKTNYLGVAGSNGEDDASTTGQGGGAYAALYQVAAQNTDNHFSDAAPL